MSWIFGVGCICLWFLVICSIVVEVFICKTWIGMICWGRISKCSTFNPQAHVYSIWTICVMFCCLLLTLHTWSKSPYNGRNTAWRAVQCLSALVAMRLSGTNFSSCPQLSRECNIHMQIIAPTIQLMQQAHKLHAAHAIVWSSFSKSNSLSNCKNEQWQPYLETSSKKWQVCLGSNKRARERHEDSRAGLHRHQTCLSTYGSDWKVVTWKGVGWCVVGR